MVLAPASNSLGVAEGAVPAAGPRAAAAALHTAETDQRERCWQREIVELIERSDAHKPCLAPPRECSCLTR